MDVFADATDDVSLQETKVAAVDPPELSEELRDRIVRQVRVPTFIFLTLIWEQKRDAFSLFSPTYFWSFRENKEKEALPFPFSIC